LEVSFNTSRRIKDLSEAIRADKYWSLSPGRRDAFYVIALTRAQIPVGDGYQARVTHLDRVVVSRDAAKFCRKGRILMVELKGRRPIAKSVVSWAAFVRLMREDSEQIYFLFKGDKIPPFIGLKELRVLTNSSDRIY
jgi:hypothetical protein